MTDKDFLQWITSKLTLNQYCTLIRIVYSFKKYTKVDGPKTVAYCDFKDARTCFVASDIPKFFDEMGSLAGDEHFRLFDYWCNDNVIFWPYKETPDLKEARQRLIQKCETHTTPYRFLYIFRENEYGEIALFEVMNKCFAGSPLWGRSLEEYIDELWKIKRCDGKQDLDDYPVAYNIEHNTKVIVKAFTGISNKEYKEYLLKVRFSEWSEDERSKLISERAGKLLFSDLNEISKYKFDSAILYNMFRFIHKYKRTIRLYGQPYHVAGYNKVLIYLMHVIKDLASEGKLKEDK